MSKEHQYQIALKWEGNRGQGTISYKDYDRLYAINVPGKETFLGSSDPGFRGDAGKYNPEEMLVMSLSSCHMLWYLHLCSVNKIIVSAYEDDAGGVMRENADGSGEFVEVLLRPKVRITSGDISLAQQLHQKAHQLCFIARSMNFPVKHSPEVISE